MNEVTVDGKTSSETIAEGQRLWHAVDAACQGARPGLDIGFDTQCQNPGNLGPDRILAGKMLVKSRPRNVQLLCNPRRRHFVRPKLKGQAECLGNNV